jgi:[acyl-carrier-protein] S-malonyltransferase
MRPCSATLIDNVTGEPFPQDVEAMKASLVRHLSRPVLWEKGIRHLLALGVRTFVEIGFGNTLTKFGFFIDRSARHSTFYTAD